jgi:endoglucanase
MINPKRGAIFVAITIVSMLFANHPVVADSVEALFGNNPTIDVWWPTANAVVTGTQPFKAMVKNADTADYTMYWMVDNGQLNYMYDSSTDYPHKEATVDVSNWNWRGQGPYQVTYRAVNKSGRVITEKVVPLMVSSTAAQSTTQDNTVQAASVEVQTATLDPIVAKPLSSTTETTFRSSGNPLAGQSLFGDPNSAAKQWADMWRASRPQDASMLDKIAGQPEAAWFGGWNYNVKNDVNAYVTKAAANAKLPTLVIYNIPQRDCGGYSAGGAGSPDSYRQWIQDIAGGMNNRKAIVILEPDALAGIDCLNGNDKETRYGLLSEAVKTLNASGAIVYVDAGHSGWHSAETMAERLKRSGIGAAQGFSLNVSNYNTTQDNTAYGLKISDMVSGKHFVIDTSRNGLGPNGSEWCNPAGRALGVKPTASTGNAKVDAYLWIKKPGESDGNCNGGPSAGQFWADYAVGLASRAAW